jgi:hypothetical protein
MVGLFAADVENMGGALPPVAAVLGGGQGRQEEIRNGKTGDA